MPSGIAPGPPEIDVSTWMGGALPSIVNKYMPMCLGLCHAHNNRLILIVVYTVLGETTILVKPSCTVSACSTTCPPEPRSTSICSSSRRVELAAALLPRPHTSPPGPKIVPQARSVRTPPAKAQRSVAPLGPPPWRTPAAAIAGTPHPAPGRPARPPRADTARPAPPSSPRAARPAPPFPAAQVPMLGLTPAGTARRPPAPTHREAVCRPVAPQPAKAGQVRCPRWRYLGTVSTLEDR